ncbi:HNH endonuclease [Acidiferrobacter sp.]|uniref:HNH endonuclease n=1 Tax=Acidiferrobacter sp. TaxID=1872107 RepID=UPI00261EC876|nr:HNH endonuclease [Acidiferrobacter sp.]
MDADDALLRKASFDHVHRLQGLHGHLTATEVANGFLFDGVRIPLINPQRGIFKPRQMRFCLSIRTVFPRSGSRIWYDDQRDAHQKIFGARDTVDYAFMGQDPKAPENQWLRVGTHGPGAAHLFPRFRARTLPSDRPGVHRRMGRDAPYRQHRLRAPRRGGAVLTQNRTGAPLRARYCQKTLHQGTFREAVLTAYKRRCALSGLPEARLLDAAHIIADGDTGYGQPVVSNGIPLSKIHHAAFDAHLIGIDPDYRLHVSEKLLVQHDGPMLEALKRLNGGTIYLPTRDRDRPDRERLARRFEDFRAAQ